MNPELPLDKRLDDLISQLTTEEKCGLLATHQAEIPRLGIKEWFVGTEVARGYVSHEEEQPSTVFPQPIGMSSMFDPELMYKLGEIAGTEARIYNKKYPSGKLMLWGPTVDLLRDPRWGRNEEGYGEDPYLTGENTSAYTLGMRGEGEKYYRTIPTLKHFCADNNERERDRCSANLEPRTKNELYYQCFKPAITCGGARSVMTCYNELSGMPGLVNTDLQRVLKDEWGLDFVVTDGGDFSQNVTSHRYSESHAETIALALKAGNDLMCDANELVKASALKALEDGLLTIEEVDQTIRRAMKARFMLGEFDPEDGNPYAKINPDMLNCEEYKQLNRRAACEQVTLLRNNGILPLKREQSIALIGPTSAYNFRDWYTGRSTYDVTVLDGINQRFSEVVHDNAFDHVAIRSKLNGKLLKLHDENKIYADGNEISDETTFIRKEWGGEENNYMCKANMLYINSGSDMAADSDTTFRWFVREILKPVQVGEYRKYKLFQDKEAFIDENGKLSAGNKRNLSDAFLFSEELLSSGIMRAVELAKSVDVPIVCVGNDPLITARECFDRKDLELPPYQKALIKAVYEANPNTVLLVISSYPYAINWEDENLPAIIYSSHAGPELGNAIAMTLTGENNPAARCPQTWYKSHHELPDIMDYDVIANDVTYMYFKGKPLYPFGYGLSYSNFVYESMSVNCSEDKLSFDVTVRNTSDIDGDEVVQIYFTPLKPRVKRPLKKLCGFRRVHIRAGESVKVSIVTAKSNLEFWDVTRGRFCVEAGKYSFMAAASCEDVRLTETVTINGETIPPRNLAVMTRAVDYDDKDGVTMQYSKPLRRHYISSSAWESELRFQAADCNFRSIEICVSTNVSSGNIKVCVDNLESAEAEITVPPTLSKDNFVCLSAVFDNKVNGMHDIILSFSNCNILDFVFKE